VSRISAFQPIGDAASELRSLLPDLTHLTAVTVLREAEETGLAQDCTGKVTVRFTQNEGWEVTIP